MKEFFSKLRPDSQLALLTATLMQAAVIMFFLHTPEEDKETALWILRIAYQLLAIFFVYIAYKKGK